MDDYLSSRYMAT